MAEEFDRRADETPEAWWSRICSRTGGETVLVTNFAGDLAAEIGEETVWNRSARVGWVSGTYYKSALTDDTGRAVWVRVGLPEPTPWRLTELLAVLR